MKTIIYALICLSQCASAMGQGITKKDLRMAKAKYRTEQNTSLRQMDSLYYEGIKAIRHDQRNEIYTDHFGSYKVRGNRKHYQSQQKPFQACAEQ